MKVSFVVPSFNAAAWLPLAVKSVLEQTYKDVEAVIVDDASTDTTGLYLDWLEAQNEPRVRILRMDKNVGRSTARNVGNEAASGGIICVLDADDMAMRDRAKLTVGAMSKSGAEFVYGSARMTDAIGAMGQEIRAEVFSREKALETLANGIVHSTVGYTKRIAREYPYAGGDIARLGIDDWHQQISVALGGERMEMIPSILSLYRHLSTGVSATRKAEDVLAAKKAHLESLRVA